MESWSRDVLTRNYAVINGKPAPDNELMVNSRIIICFQKLFPAPPTARNSDTAPPFPIPLP